MTPTTVFFFVVFGLIALAFGIISVVFFYHIGRYSYMGDASKRIFLIYLTFGITIVAATLVFIILNHILT
ncbi:MAG: hypothetical protein OEV37_04020 [Candidatus Berkelbacteria bacterium]|nr:hypothetical protein [Candidatus Berkelbacteria bacterium]